MATKRLIGPRPPMKGVTPEEKERMNNQYNVLISLVPRDLAEKLMKEVLDEIDREIENDNSVPIPKKSLQEKEIEEGIERLVNETCKGKFRKNIVRFFLRQWFKIFVVGKRIRDLCGMSVKEKRQRLKEETNDFIEALVRGWTSTMCILKDEQAKQIVRLNELLLPDNPDKEFFAKFGNGIISWLQVAMSPIFQLVPPKKQNKAITIYGDFIANLKKEVDDCGKNHKEFLLIGDINYIYTVGYDNHGYFLKIVQRS